MMSSSQIPAFGAVLASLSLMGVAMIGCAVEPAPRPPVFPGDAWAISTPAEQGMDPALLEQAVAAVKQFSGKDGTNELLIVRNGYIVWAGPDVAKRHPIWSCTKSFMSTCFGLLWDDGKLAPGDLAHTHYPELTAKYPAVTLEHLATFTSGYDHGDTPLDIADPQHAPGAAFHYSMQSDLLAAILTRVAGKPIAELFDVRIAKPIGITADDMHWGSFAEQDGLTINGGAGRPNTGVEISALAMARFGWLYANHGIWNGQRLISQRYIDHATVPRTSPDTPPFDPKAWYIALPGNYGFNWWTNGPRPDGKRHWPHAPENMFVAQGNRNNNCFIVPDWNMVIVRMGTDDIVDMRLYDRMFELLGRSIGARQ